MWKWQGSLIQVKYVKSIRQCNKSTYTIQKHFYSTFFLQSTRAAKCHAKAEALHGSVSLPSHSSQRLCFITAHVHTVNACQVSSRKTTGCFALSEKAYLKVSIVVLTE